MRSNLINQLNHWGFHKLLGLGNSADLFSMSRHLVQKTALLRYPVFVKDDDYRDSPGMPKHPLLRKYLLENFAAEVEELKNAGLVTSSATEVRQSPHATNPVPYDPSRQAFRERFATA